MQLLSVTSNNPQFHPASFLPQALPPDGETSFQASGVGGCTLVEMFRVSLIVRERYVLLGCSFFFVRYVV